MNQQLTKKNLTIALLAVALSTIAGCGIHSFDESQVPVVSVDPSGAQPVISWTPQQAYRLTVYAGTADGDGLGALWSTYATEYANQLNSPVTYGVVPAGSTSTGRAAPPLEAGQTYTVTVRRKDPKGTGDGFTNTHKNYVGKKTFIAQ